MKFELNDLAPSLTVSFHQKAHQMRLSGEQIYDLTVGEAKVPTHPLILKAVQNKLQSEAVYYSPVAGYPKLRELSTSWMNHRYGAEYKPSECLSTSGGKFGLFLLMKALLQAGDQVLIPVPFWTSYPTMVRSFGADPILVPTFAKDEFCPCVAELKKQITPKTKAIILNSAANPTGALYSKSLVEELLEFAEKHNLLVFSDEVYSELCYEREFVSCAAFPAHRERVFVVQSCSKNFAMTGWRLGFVFGDKDVISCLARIQGQSITSPCAVSQWAGCEAFAQADKITNWLRDEMRKRRDRFVAHLNQLFGLSLVNPSSALYVFIRLSEMGFSEQEAKNSMQTCLSVLSEAKVAMVPGIAFGQEGFVRCSFSGPIEESLEALERLKKHTESK